MLLEPLLVVLSLLLLYDEYRDLPLLQHAAVVAVVILLNTVAVVVSVAIEVIFSGGAATSTTAHNTHPCLTS